MTIKSEPWSYAHGLEIANRAFAVFQSAGKLTSHWRARFGRDNSKVPAYFIEDRVMWVMKIIYSHRGPTDRCQFIPFRGMSPFDPTIKAGLKRLKRVER